MFKGSVDEFRGFALLGDGGNLAIADHYAQVRIRSSHCFVPPIPPASTSNHASQFGVVLKKYSGSSSDVATTLGVFAHKVH